MSKIEFTAQDADTLRRTVVQLAATLKGIELQLNSIAGSTEALINMQLDIEGLREDLVIRHRSSQKS